MSMNSPFQILWDSLGGMGIAHGPAIGTQAESGAKGLWLIAGAGVHELLHLLKMPLSGGEGYALYS